MFTLLPFTQKPVRLFFGIFPFLISNKPTEIDLQRKRFYDGVYGRLPD